MEGSKAKSGKSVLGFEILPFNSVTQMRGAGLKLR